MSACVHILKKIITPAICLLTPLAAPAQLDPGPHVLPLEPSHTVNEFRRYVEETLLPYTPGLAVAIVEKDRPSSINTYGIRRLGGTDAVDSHTTFRLASLSKAFAAATAGILVSEGNLDWDNKINSYLPDLRLKDTQMQDAISVRHILSNSTGLMPHSYTNLVEDSVPYERILEKMDDVDFVCAPGKCYTYQNVVYSMIGDIMQNVTGSEYSTLVEDRIFAPLQMQDASLTFEDFIANSNHAVPHERTRKRTLRATSVKENYYSVAPAAGVNASITDMEAWLQALLGNRPDILPEQVLKELFSYQTPVNQRSFYRGSWKNVKSSYYGLGWRVFDYSDTLVAYHAGWVQGYHAEIVLIPSEGVGMALLMNSDYTNGITAAPKFLDISLGLQE